MASRFLPGSWMSRLSSSAFSPARSEAKEVMVRWDIMQSKNLSAFNATLVARGQRALALPSPRMPAALPSDENGNDE